jgi:hypothetical protein
MEVAWGNDSPQGEGAARGEGVACGKGVWYALLIGAERLGIHRS